MATRPPNRREERLRDKRHSRARRIELGPYVYFMLAESVSMLKIGTAVDPLKRHKSIAASSPVPVVLLGSVIGSVNVERWCHYHCFVDRSHFEWFRLTPKTDAFVRLVLSHGTDAASLMCHKHHRADRLLVQKRPVYAGSLNPLPWTGRLDWEMDRAAAASECPCDRCKAYLRGVL